MDPLWSYFPRCSLSLSLFFFNSECVLFCNQIIAVLCLWLKMEDFQPEGQREHRGAFCTMSSQISLPSHSSSWRTCFMECSFQRSSSEEVNATSPKEQSTFTRILYCQLPTSEAKSFSTVGSFNKRLESWVYLHLFYFVYRPYHAACRILVPWLGIKPVPSALEARSLNHWTTRDVPCNNFRSNFGVFYYSPHKPTST